MVSEGRISLTSHLRHLVSGANNLENISFSPQIATICRLTRSGVLEVPRVMCNNEKEVQKHLRELEYYANGHHFCQEGSIGPVFNTQPALSYLEVSRPSFSDTNDSVISLSKSTV
jgi:hypothetical protein